MRNVYKFQKLGQLKIVLKGGILRSNKGTGLYRCSQNRTVPFSQFYRHIALQNRLCEGSSKRVTHVKHAGEKIIFNSVSRVSQI